jgi:hypothetical protein
MTELINSLKTTLGNSTPDLSTGGSAGVMAQCGALGTRGLRARGPSSMRAVMSDRSTGGSEELSHTYIRIALATMRPQGRIGAYRSLPIAKRGQERDDV